jgi:oligopeptide transport system ATP-binding protein
LITHDLGVVAGSTEKLTVMYAGSALEQGSTAEVLANPTHPYTVGLLRSIPRLDRPRGGLLIPIPGAPPDMSKTSEGCSFEPRCEFAQSKCAVQNPIMVPVMNNRSAACFYPSVTKVNG